MNKLKLDFTTHGYYHQNSIKYQIHWVITVSRNESSMPGYYKPKNLKDRKQQHLKQ